MAMPKQKPGKSKQDYQTPVELLQAVKRRLHIDDFTIDLAASESNKVTSKCYTEADNALVQSWVFDGWCWLNPPFAHIQPWVEKAYWESGRGAQIAMLVPASVGSNWWSRYVQRGAYACYLQPRLTFVGETDPYPKDCALLLYTPWSFVGNEVWRWDD